MTIVTDSIMRSAMAADATTSVAMMVAGGIDAKGKKVWMEYGRHAMLGSKVRSNPRLSERPALFKSI